MSSRALDLLRAAYDTPEAIAQRCAYEGGTVLRVLGTDAPWELLDAVGVQAVRLTAIARPTPQADELLGHAATWRIRSLLEQALEAAPTPVLITRSDTAQAQVFATLRELGRLGGHTLGPIYLHDCLHRNQAPSRQYNEHRLAELCTWLQTIGGKLDNLQARLEDARSRQASRTLLLEELNHRRTDYAASLNGSDLLRIIGAGAVLPPMEYEHLLQELTRDCTALSATRGLRVFLTGSLHESAHVYELIEASGALIVGEDHDWGSRWYLEARPAAEDILRQWADPNLRPPATTRSLAADAAWLRQHIAASRAEAVVHLTLSGDECAPWLLHQLRAVAEQLRIPVLRLDCTPLMDCDSDRSARAALADFVNRGGHRVAITSSTKSPDVASGRLPTPSPDRSHHSSRSQKTLSSVATFGRYQRDWFQSVRSRALAGEPFAIVNANAPQEFLRVLDIPFVVNQWWASIVAAKQQSERYAGLLNSAGYPIGGEIYSAQGLAAALDEDPDHAPWGGLPTPDYLLATTSSDPTTRIFDAWAQRTGAKLFLFERSVDPRWTISERWWIDLIEEWDKALEPARIDLQVAEIEDAIAQLTQMTGRKFELDALQHVMTLVNEQEEYYKRARDLIASTIPAPVGIVDTMPATMVPQWHRGTRWARDAAKAFYDEVTGRVQRKEGAIREERIRLMWVGRGLWSNMGFYQRWEASHGAIFVWSMYLGLAADGYMRKLDGDRDPLRAMAARFIPMGDELRMPTWAAAWHVKEAQTHRVDGAIALTDADPFVLWALRSSGTPVLQLGIDNFADIAASEDLDSRVRAFLEGPAVQAAARRRADSH